MSSCKVAVCWFLGRRLSTWQMIAASCPTALGALCGQLTSWLAWCYKHSAVMATELLQLLDLACGLFGKTTESVHCTITGPCMTVLIRNIYPLFRSSCIIQTSPTNRLDDSWGDTIWGRMNTALCDSLYVAPYKTLTYLKIRVRVRSRLKIRVTIMVRVRVEQLSFSHFHTLYLPCLYGSGLKPGPARTEQTWPTRPKKRPGPARPKPFTCHYWHGLKHGPARPGSARWTASPLKCQWPWMGDVSYVMTGCYCFITSAYLVDR